MIWMFLETLRIIGNGPLGIFLGPKSSKLPLNAHKQPLNAHKQSSRMFDHVHKL